MEGDLLAVDGPGPVKVYLDQVLKQLAPDAQLDYLPYREKFWLRHPQLD